MADDRAALALCAGNPLCTPTAPVRGNSKDPQIGVTSAFEVEYTSISKPSDAMWLPVAMPQSKTHPNDTNTLTIPIFPAGVAGWKVTGIRYAWGENPCCPGIQEGLMPCPVNNCPLQTASTRLPAVPFMAKITDQGFCECSAPKACDEVPQ